MGIRDRYQNLNLIQLHNPDLVLVFGADHVYRMDLQQMIDFHHEREADVTVAALPVPIDEARGFGVIVADHAGRVNEFQEKPANPTPMPSDPSRAYASMGNYLFDAKVLVEALKAANERGEHDFGQHVLPHLKETHRLFAYDFATNKVPGTKPYEEPAYWRDVGTLDAYYNAHQDLLGLTPRFDVFNPQWRIFSSNYQGPVARILDAVSYTHLDVYKRQLASRAGSGLRALSSADKNTRSASDPQVRGSARARSNSK